MTNRCANPRLVAVVDDEEIQRVSLSRLLRSHGYTAAPFANGESFLEKHDQIHFPCILLDLQMPEMNGFEILERLSPKAKIVVLTAMDLDECQNRVLQLGASACLRKPVEQSELFEAIEGAPPFSNEKPQNLDSA